MASSTSLAALPIEVQECLQWLHVKLVLSRGVSLSEEQLLQLAHVVGGDAVRLPCTRAGPSSDRAVAWRHRVTAWLVVHVLF
jgi:hypothetical protein